MENPFLTAYCTRKGRRKKGILRRTPVRIQYTLLHTNKLHTQSRCHVRVCVCLRVLVCTICEYSMWVCCVSAIYECACIRVFVHGDLLLYWVVFVCMNNWTYKYNSNGSRLAVRFGFTLWMDMIYTLNMLHHYERESNISTERRTSRLLLFLLLLLLLLLPRLAFAEYDQNSNISIMERTSQITRIL